MSCDKCGAALNYEGTCPNCGTAHALPQLGLLDSDRRKRERYKLLLNEYNADYKKNKRKAMMNDYPSHAALYVLFGCMVTVAVIIVFAALTYGGSAVGGVVFGAVSVFAIAVTALDQARRAGKWKRYGSLIDDPRTVRYDCRITEVRRETYGMSSARYTDMICKFSHAGNKTDAFDMCAFRLIGDVFDEQIIGMKITFYEFLNGEKMIAVNFPQGYSVKVVAYNLFFGAARIKQPEYRIPIITD